jgi:hypothetical protein
MANQNALAVLVHAALKRAAYHEQDAIDGVGYGLLQLKTGEVQVHHEPSTDDPKGHALVYHAALVAAPALRGLNIEYRDLPYPQVLICG